MGNVGWYDERPSEVDHQHSISIQYFLHYYHQNGRNGDLNPTDAFKRTSIFSTAEIAYPYFPTKRYLIVGYAPWTLKDEHKIKNTAYQDGRLIAVGLTQPSNIIPWDCQAPPVLVATPMTYREGDPQKLFALVKPTNGLCTPYIIDKQRVFIRWEYRSILR